MGNLPDRKTIYLSEELHVFSRFHTDAALPSIMICFSNWQPRRHLLTDEVFGERVFSRTGVNGIYVNCASNAWWQYPDLHRAIDAIRNAAQGRALVTYGSSMGGYAAIRFAKRLGAIRSVAICPQFSIRPAVIPGEDRWLTEASSTDFLYEDNVDVCPHCSYTIVYDNLYRKDTQHIEAYRRLMPISKIGLPCSGHPPLESLVAYGLASWFAAAAANGPIDVEHIRITCRLRRRDTTRYWQELASRSREHGHLRWAATASDQRARIGNKAGVEREDDPQPDLDKAAISRKAWLYHNAGNFVAAASLWQTFRIQWPNDWDGYIGGGSALVATRQLKAAEAIYIEALRRFPPFPTLLQDFAWLALHQSDAQEALSRCRFATMLFPELSSTHLQLARFLFSAGSFEESATAADKCLVLEPGNAEAAALKQQARTRIRSDLN